MLTVRGLLSVLVFAGCLSASTIFSEDFNGGVVSQVITPTSSLGTDGRTPLETGTQFEVIGGSIDMITAADPYFTMCGTGTSCIDMTGSGLPRAGGSIRTVNEIFFAAGDYEVSIDLQGWKDFNNFTRAAEIQVLLPGLVDVSFVRDGASNPYAPEIILFSVAAPTSVKLTIQDVSNTADPIYGSRVSSFSGAILDDVEIVRLGADEATVPEPSTLLLMAPLLAGLLYLRRARLTATPRS